MKPKSKNLVNGIVSFVLTICILMSGGLATVGSYITKGISVYAVTVTANDFVWDLSDDGVLTITGTGEMSSYDWTKSSFTKSQVKTIVISEGVTSVIANAFSGCEWLTEVQFPDSLKKIGYSAFWNCSSLSKINYPKGLEEVTSYLYNDGKVFYNCPIKSVTVPEGVTKIPSYLFNNANQLESIELSDSVKDIGVASFSNSGLKSIKLGSSLATIGANAFSGCEQLAEIQFPDSLKKIGYSAFWNCSSLSEINYPKGLEEVTSYLYNDGKVFYNCPIKSITVPEGVTKIPSYLFNNANKLENIIISKSVTEIKNNVFSNCPNLTVYVPSYKKYLVDLIDKDIHFVVLNEKQSDDSMIVNRDECDYTTSFSSVKNGGSVAITCDYSINSFYSSIKNPYITIKIPNGTELIAKTLMYNGKICNTYSDKGKTITIPIEEQKGKITFSVKLIESKDILSYATLNYQMNNKKDYDIIGIINENIPSISISAPSITNTQQVTVSGVAPVGKEVSLYANDKLIDKVMPNKVGAYTASINLPETEDGKTYTLKAVSTDNDSKELFAVTYLQFLTEIPTLSGFTLDYNGRNYDLMSKTKPNIVFASSYPMKFTVKFNYPEKVKYVYVTSDRNNVTKRMKAEWNESSKAFIAEGFFDESNHSYVPGKINVYYSEEDSMYTPLKELFEFNLDEEKIKEKFTAEVITDTSQERTISLKTDDGLDMIFSQQTKNVEDDLSTVIRDETVRNTIVRQIESGEDIQIIKYSLQNANVGAVCTVGDNQLILVCEDDNKGTVHQYTSGDKKAELFCLDFGIGYATGEAASSYLEMVVTGFTWNPAAGEAGKIAGGMIWSAATGTYQILDYTIKADSAFERMRYEIEHSDYSPEEKSARYKQLKNYEMALGILQMMDVSCMAADIILGITISNPVTAIIAAFGLSLIREATVGSMVDQLLCLLGLSDDSSINWCIDPSGYVYEGVTSNRLPNVKATAYWIPFDEETYDETFWDKPQTDRAELWKAEEWSQQNPLITDNDGNYAWDVPEGWWQVKYELDGYETVYSEWLPVPPPQTDVHIGMISLKTPNVVSAKITDDGLKIVFDSYMNPETIGNVVLRTVSGQEIEYTVDFGTEETDLDGKVFAKEFLFKLSEESKIKSVTVPDTVLNYCGKHIEKFTKEFVVESEGIFGDTNGDESVDIADALMIARYDAGLIQLDGNQLSVSDVNKDDSVDIADALMIARYDAGLISSL